MILTLNMRGGQSFKLKPGSERARDKGCTCPDSDGGTIYLDTKCEVHRPAQDVIPWRKEKKEDESKFVETKKKPKLKAFKGLKKKKR